MPLVPWWVLLSSGCAPVVLIGGWALAETVQPAGYDPMVQSISSLAAYGASDRWMMTASLFLVGVCHAVTALGLRAAALPGRIALGCGGGAAVMVALSPEPGGGTTLRHLVSTGVGFTALALWPVLAATRPGRAMVWALRPWAGYATMVLMTAGAAWFLVELHGHGAAGLVERILTGYQSIWPLIAVAACVAGRLRLGTAAVPSAALTSRSESSESYR
jgi:hypothetical protein